MNSILVFLGSERVSGAPFPTRLGARVSAACVRHLAGKNVSTSEIDPLQIRSPHPFKPHFSYALGKAPQALDQLADQIQKADGYVMVSPEYNHLMSPALSDLLNHFGSSLFSYKPSAIVTYSAGQWGGTRAAVSMRTFLAELGCLPVSAMIHVPHAQDVFDADGGYREGVDSHHWSGYLDRTFEQLCWWTDAAAWQRYENAERPALFLTSPLERNAPEVGRPPPTIGK